MNFQLQYLISWTGDLKWDRECGRGERNLRDAASYTRILLKAMALTP